MESNKKQQLIAFVIFLIISIVISLFLFQLSMNLVWVWIIGLGIGIILQRSNFCFAGGFMNFFFFKDVKILKAIIILIGLSTIGFAIHQYSIFTAQQQVIGAVSPWGISTVMGGVLFGLGMSLAGGCACSTLMRLGEGSITFFFVFIGLIIGNVVGVDHLEWWWERFRTMPAVFLPQYLGWFKAIFLQLGILFIIYIILNRLEKK
jgi:hypothetical protein